MTGTAAVLVGAQVIAAILIMIGIRSLAQDRSRAGAHQIGAGAALWVLAELGAAPGWTDLLTHLRPWVGGCGRGRRQLRHRAHLLAVAARPALQPINDRRKRNTMITILLRGGAAGAQRRPA